MTRTTLRLYRPKELYRSRTCEITCYSRPSTDLTELVATFAKVDNDDIQAFIGLIRFHCNNNLASGLRFELTHLNYRISTKYILQSSAHAIQLCPAYFAPHYFCIHHRRQFWQLLFLAKRLDANESFVCLLRR